MLKPDRFSCSKKSGLSGTHLYKRTAPSVLYNIAEELAVNNSVVGTYRKLVKKCTNSKEQGVMNQGNPRQIKNLQNYIKSKETHQLR